LISNNPIHGFRRELISVSRSVDSSSNSASGALNKENNESIGTSFLNISHDLRYAAVIDFILKRYINKESDCFNIKTKIFYKYGPELNKTWEHIQKTTENKIDGLIFTPVDHNIIFLEIQMILLFLKNYPWIHH
jgi:hypothetical protein